MSKEHKVKVHSVVIMKGDTIIFEYNDIMGYKFENDNQFLIIFYDNNFRDVIKLTNDLCVKIVLEEVQ